MSSGSGFASLTNRLLTIVRVSHEVVASGFSVSLCSAVIGASTGVSRINVSELGVSATVTVEFSIGKTSGVIEIDDGPGVSMSFVPFIGSTSSEVSRGASFTRESDTVTGAVSTIDVCFAIGIRGGKARRTNRGSLTCSVVMAS